MPTIFILASRSDEQYVAAFWNHLMMLRRTLPGVQWANPLYVEDMLSTNAVVPMMPQPSIVIGCLSSTFLSCVLEQPALREMIVQAYRPIPLVISACDWDRFPSPFAGKMPLIQQPVNEQRFSDAVFTQAVVRLREALTTILRMGK